MGVRRWLAHSIEAYVREAFTDMYNKRGLSHYGMEVLDIGSDISFITETFPDLLERVGCNLLPDKLPWRAKNTDQISYRAELRRGYKENSNRYLAVLWESYQNYPNKYRLIYKTNYKQFLIDRKVKQK